MKTILVKGRAIVTMATEVEIEVEIGDDEDEDDALDSAKPDTDEWVDGTVIDFQEWGNVSAQDITDRDDEEEGEE